MVTPMIPFHKSSFEIGEYTRDCFETGMMSTGKYVDELEKSFEKYLNCKHVVAVDNCTNGLFLALSYFHGGDDMELSVPSMTFASVANVVLQTGNQLRFDDRFIAGTAYVIGGTNIYDSAHELCPAQQYEIGDARVFSFYPTKPWPSAEGGIIATNDDDFAAWARLARNNGRDKGGWNYTIHFPGWKMNMTNLQAAILLDNYGPYVYQGYQKLKRAKYNKLLNTESINPSTHLYIVRVRDRSELMRKLDDEGIGYSVHFKPLHLQPAYKRIPVSNPSAIEKLSQEIISLPFYPDLLEDQIEYISSIVKPYVIHNT